MQIIPQPCKDWGKPGWDEVGTGPQSLLIGWAPLSAGDWRDASMGNEWAGSTCSAFRRGFCFFNSVAIACRQLQQQGKASKILIVDWVGPGSSHLQIQGLTEGALSLAACLGPALSLLEPQFSLVQSLGEDR